jgi:hypothetical protein
MSFQSAIFLSKTEARVPRLPRREKRRKEKRVLGGSRLSRRRHSCAPSRAVGPSCCPATGRNAHASVRLVTEWAFAKAGQRETSRLIWNAAFRPDGSEQQKG